MTSHQQKEFKKVRKLAAMYNMVPNLLWTAIFLVPITIFCYKYITPGITCIFLVASLAAILFPNSFFDKIQLSKSPYWYKKIGVTYLNAFAQNGSFVNKMIKKKYPGFKVVFNTRASIKKHYYQTYFFEKFHFSLFVFFVMITVYAALQSRFYWVATLTTSNLFYNVYPNLLQQYIRVKLRGALPAPGESALYVKK